MPCACIAARRTVFSHQFPACLHGQRGVAAHGERPLDAACAAWIEANYDAHLPDARTALAQRSCATLRPDYPQMHHPYNCLASLQLVGSCCGQQNRQSVRPPILTCARPAGRSTYMVAVLRTLGVPPTRARPGICWPATIRCVAPVAVAATRPHDGLGVGAVGSSIRPGLRPVGAETRHDSG